MSDRRRDDRIVITRTQIGRAGSIVGGLAFIIALVLFIWQGELTAWGLAALVAGMAGLGLWMAIAPGDFQDWVTGRAARYGGNSALGTLIVIAVAIALYGWADAQNLAVDMTFPQNFTLSPATRDVLARLDRPVQLTGFYSPAAQAQRDRDEAVFHLFEAALGERFRVVYVDPMEEQVLAGRFGAADGSAFLTFVDEETGQPDLRAIVPVDLVDAQERAVANALLQLLAAGRFKIYFTAGHGEPDPADRSPDGLAFVFDGLVASGILAETLDPAVLNQGVPADATAVVIAGAGEPLSTNEVQAIIAYLEGGGRLFLAADPRLDPRQTFMTADDPLRVYLADSFGLALRDDLVVDESSSFQDPINVISGEVVPHETTARLVDGNPVAFFGSRDRPGGHLGSGGLPAGRGRPRRAAGPGGGGAEHRHGRPRGAGRRRRLHPQCPDRLPGQSFLLHRCPGLADPVLRAGRDRAGGRSHPPAADHGLRRHRPGHAGGGAGRGFPGLESSAAPVSGDLSPVRRHA